MIHYLKNQKLKQLIERYVEVFDPGLFSDRVEDLIIGYFRIANLADGKSCSYESINFKKVEGVSSSRPRHRVIERLKEFENQISKSSVVFRLAFTGAIESRYFYFDRNTEELSKLIEVQLVMDT